MAKRAKEPFNHAGRRFTKDQVVPSDVAKKVPELVYDDAPEKPARKRKSDA